MVLEARPIELPVRDLERVLREALTEDVGTGDVTTEATVDSSATCEAQILLKQPGVVCGLLAAAAVFRTLDSGISFEPLAAEGEIVSGPPAVVGRVTGSTRAVLTGERTALNLLGRLSGVATLTRRFVDAVEGTECVILDTRKIGRASCRERV